MSFVDWIQERVSPENRRVMQHFDHPHTPEEAKACLQAIRDSQADLMAYEVRRIKLSMWLFCPLSFLVSFVFERWWQYAAWFLWCFFADRAATISGTRPERKPIKWACRRLS